MYFNLSTIQDNQQFLSELIHTNPVRYAALYILIFFVLTVSGLPVTLIMITASGFLFGTTLGSIYSLIAVLMSSITIFTLSKKMFGFYLQHRYEHQLKKFNENFKKYGFYYILAIRILPVIPFFLVNIAAGLTHLDSKKFLLATLIGALPTILVWTYLGSQCASLMINW